MRTTSGRRSAASATASSPSPASPTTSTPSMRAEHHREAFAEHRVVVGDEHPQDLASDHASHLRAARLSGTRRPREVVDGQPGEHERPTGRARGDRAGAAELLGAFAHRRQADPGDRCGRQAAPVVRDRDLERVDHALDPEPHRAGPGVPGGVVQRLGRDPVARRPPRRRGGRRRRRGPPRARRGRRWRSRRPTARSPRRARGRPAPRAARSTIRRTVATAPVRSDSARDESAATSSSVVRLRTSPPGGPPRRATGPEVVVQVAAQPAPLLLAGGDDPFARRLQSLRQLHGVGGDRDVAGEVVEEPQVTG